MATEAPKPGGGNREAQPASAATLSLSGAESNGSSSASLGSLKGRGSLVAHAIANAGPGGAAQAAQAAEQAANAYFNALIIKANLDQSPAEQEVIDKINILYSFDNSDDFLGELKLSDDRKADVVKTFKKEKYFKDFCSDMIKENNEDESYFIFLDKLLKYCLDSENLSRILSKGNIVENFELLLTVMKTAKYDKYLFNTIYRLVPTLENKFELPDYELDNNLKKAHIYWLLKFMNLI